MTQQHDVKEIISLPRHALMEAHLTPELAPLTFPVGFPEGLDEVAVQVQEIAQLEGRIYSLVELPEASFPEVFNRWTYVWSAPTSAEMSIKIDGVACGIECWCSSKTLAVCQIGITIGMRRGGV